MTMRRFALICVSLLALTSVRATAEDALLEGFRNPPLAARPSIYWAWVNGLTNKEQMTWELEELKAKGIGGVYIFDIGAQDPAGIVPEGPAFMGPESLDAIGHTVREATRLGLEVGLVTSSSWNCGGPWIHRSTPAWGSITARSTCKAQRGWTIRCLCPSCPPGRRAARMASRPI